MECCQRLHPQFIVFKQQRSSPVCEMLAMAICESTFSAPAKKHFNAEAPALKRQYQIDPMKSVQNPQIWPNLAHANVRFAVVFFFFFKTRCFYEHGSRSTGMFLFTLKL